MLSGLSVAGSGGAVAGGADAMDGDGDGWEPVAEMVDVLGLVLWGPTAPVVEVVVVLVVSRRWPMEVAVEVKVEVKVVCLGERLSKVAKPPGA